MPETAHRDTGTEARSGSELMNVIANLLSVLSAVAVCVAVCAAQTTAPPPGDAPPPFRTTTSRPSPSPGRSPAADQADDDVVRVRTTLVSSPVKVTGRDGKYIPNLRSEDFHLYEDGVEQPIAYFAPVEKPFTVALLIDTSRSSVASLQDIQDAAVAFVDSMRAGDRALVLAFDDRLRLLSAPTGDRDALRRAIYRTGPGGGTRLYDALASAIHRQLDKAEGRRAIILFTDGVDTASKEATLESTLRDAEQPDTPQIYAVKFETLETMKGLARNARRAAPEGSGFSTADYIRADAYLHALAARSGAVLYTARDVARMDRAIALIADELHNEYSLGYYPKKPIARGEHRHIEVRVNQPQLVIQARLSYEADQPAGTSGVTPRRDAGAENAATPERALTLPDSDFGVMPLPRPVADERPSPGARWTCKGATVPFDYAIVAGGFDAHCPKAAGGGAAGFNAWYISRPGPAETLCKGYVVRGGREVEEASVPTGYVVTGQIDSKACEPSSDPKQRYNAWSVKLPADGDTVCLGFPLPPGFVMTAKTTSATCPPSARGAQNGWLISRPARSDR